MTGEFAVSLEQSLRFARLSGDYNPLHIDPVSARRTQFGSTVVHGIHALLKTFDLLADRLFEGGFEPGAVSVTFSNPVRTGAEVRFRATLDPATQRVQVQAESGDARAFSVTLDLRSGTTGTGNHPLHDGIPEREPPLSDGFPEPNAAGEVVLSLPLADCAALFPQLERPENRGWVGDLLASTRIVGMKCPGMHSIYSGFKFRRHEDEASAASGRMRFVVEKTDPRFRMIRLGVKGGWFEGTIDGFFRPPPVHQLSFPEIAATVQKGEFAGQHALVIGGSRGLGEITAKILVAGGADVAVTYARGAEDAETICREARDFGGECTALHWDLTAPLSGESLPRLAGKPFTHVYFFASPHISKNASGRWNHALFEHFAGFYVDGFAALAQALLTGERGSGHRLPVFLYPSTVFLDDPEKGFAEYGAAKAAGEALCDHLGRQFGTLFHHPRLPRMKTDQTSGLLGAGAQDAFPVMLEALRDFHSRATGFMEKPAK